jgi:ring-1,2-phenylacetyl-CoA epoxidase subunit PaaE
MSGTTFHPLRIAEIRRETADAISIAFEVPETLRPSFAFTPGQYLTLRAKLGDEEVRRSYSICSGADDGELRVGIKHVPDGLFSAHANTALREGETVDVMAPAGRFGVPIDGEAARVHVGIAAGSGITPILSILKTVLAREPNSHFILLYGSRSTAGIMFRETLEDLKDRYLGRLSVIHVLSREEQDIAVLNGRLDAAKLRALLPASVEPAKIDHLFICGPSTMIDELTVEARALGVATDRIHSERFTDAGAPVRAPRPAKIVVNAPAFATATIIHDGKTNIVPIAEGEPVLDAALRAGLDLPWSCRGGMCSTCRARLTEGHVEMTQNFSLEPWELEGGYVLTCQSHPTTPTLVVDYDQV